MRRSRFMAIAFLLLFAFILGCSGAGNMREPVTPLAEDKAPVADTPTYGTTSLMGLWQVTIDRETGTIDAVDMRSSGLIINVLGFLEPPVLSGMSIDFSTLVLNPGNNTVSVDVILKHPINDPVFMGFDVRGVVFGPKLVNCDGLTIIPSPQFFAGVPFGYQDGMLGAPDGYANYEGLAGYKYFCDGLGKDDDLATFMSNTGNLANRGVFPNGMTLTRHYDLSWADTSPPITFLIFNYAIYANYNWPTGDAPIDITDFDITTANGAEAFCCKVTELSNSLYYAGGSGGGAITLQAEIWDWQGDISDVGLDFVWWEEGAYPHDSHFTLVGPGSTPYSYLYKATDVPYSPTTVGELDILVTPHDAKTFGEAWFMGLLPSTHEKYNEKVFNSFIYTTTVKGCPKPTVTNISPNYHAADGIPFPATVTGTNFVDGTSKAVKLKRMGETDIVATNVVVSSLTKMTCTLTIPNGTAPGKWDVEVTNGCDEAALGSGLFQVTSGTGGPKNISLRPLPGVLPTYPWVQDLAVDPANGDLYILYQDREIWRHPAGNYTTGALLTLPPNPYGGTEPVYFGFIDISPNHWAAVGFRRGNATSPRSNWQHINLANPSEVVLNTTTTQLAYVAGDVVAFGGSGAYAQDHLNISGVSSGSGGPYWNVNGLALDTTTYANPTFYNNGNVAFGTATGSVNTYVPTTFKGCEADKSGDYFWALKRYTYATVDPPVDTAWCSRFNRNASNIVTYTNAYFGTGVPGNDDTTWNSPFDLTRDIQNRYIVVDKLSDNTLRLKAWDVKTSPGTSLGGFNLTGLTGDAAAAGFRIRADCDDNNATADGNILFIIHGDHTNGFFLSLFYPPELPW